MPPTARRKSFLEIPKSSYRHSVNSELVIKTSIDSLIESTQNLSFRMIQ